MLDHVFTDAIDALRQSLEKALLERVAQLEDEAGNFQSAMAEAEDRVAAHREEVAAARARQDSQERALEEAKAWALSQQGVAQEHILVPVAVDVGERRDDALRVTHDRRVSGGLFSSQCA